MRFRYFELLILLTFCIAGASAGTGADDIKYSIYPVSGGEDEYEITVTSSTDALSALAVCFPGNFELIRSGMPDDMYRIAGNNLLIVLPGEETFILGVKCPDISDNPVTVIVEDIENSRTSTLIYDKSGNCLSDDCSGSVDDISSGNKKDANIAGGSSVSGTVTPDNSAVKRGGKL
jgi:hypothetical protein